MSLKNIPPHPKRYRHRLVYTAFLEHIYMQRKRF